MTYCYSHILCAEVVNPCGWVYIGALKQCKIVVHDAGSGGEGQQPSWGLRCGTPPVYIHPKTNA